MYLSLLVASVSDLKKARIAAEGIVGVLNEPAVDMDNLSDEGFRPVNGFHKNSANFHVFQKFEGRLRLHRVEFRYPSRPILPVLRNISLEVQPGETLAIGRQFSIFGWNYSINTLFSKKLALRGAAKAR